MVCTILKSAPGRDVPSRICAFCTRKQTFFGPKRPRNPFKTANQRETLRTLQVRLDYPVTKSHLLYLHDMSEKRPKNG